MANKSFKFHECACAKLLTAVSVVLIGTGCTPMMAAHAPALIAAALAGAAISDAFDHPSSNQNESRPPQVIYIQADHNTPAPARPESSQGHRIANARSVVESSSPISLATGQQDRQNPIPNPTLDQKRIMPQRDTAVGRVSTVTTREIDPRTGQVISETVTTTYAHTEGYSLGVLTGVVLALGLIAFALGFFKWRYA